MKYVMFLEQQISVGKVLLLLRVYVFVMSATVGMSPQSFVAVDV
jgi:hypothetical protein